MVLPTIFLNMALHDMKSNVIIIYNFAYASGIRKMGRTIWGLKDVGVGGFTPGNPPESLIITTRRSHSNPVVENALQVMKAAQILRVGGAGYKVIMFAMYTKMASFHHK